jgi:peptidoglycan/LPS O-acetylase OafA/YrhL
MRPLKYPLGYKPALDGLRACAVMPVLLFHSSVPGFGWGWIGVDLFFVLSGYLITATLLKEHIETGRIAFGSFYRRRALRLFPALALMCGGFAASAAAFFPQIDWPREVLPVALYYANWTRAADLLMPFYLGHTWSLAIEEQFYLVWPLLLCGILLLGRRPLHIIVVLIVAIACWRIALYVAGATPQRLYNGSDTRADALLIGAALAVMPNARPPAWLWLPATAVIVGLPARFNWDTGVMVVAGFAAVSLSSAILLACTLSNVALARAIAAAPLVWIGKRSYGLYLYHFPIMVIARQQFHVTAWPAVATATIGGTFVAAALSYRFVEKPFLDRRYASAAPRARPATP